MEGLTRDKVVDGRNLMNVERLEDLFAARSFYQQEMRTLISLSPRVSWKVGEIHTVRFRKPRSIPPVAT